MRGGKEMKGRERREGRLAGSWNRKGCTLYVYTRMGKKRLSVQSMNDLLNLLSLSGNRCERRLNPTD